MLITNIQYIVIVLIALSLLIYFIGGLVIIIASVIVIFEKCFFGRINIIPGIEFTTLSILLVTLKYGLLGGILFSLAIPLIASAINLTIGEKWIINSGFQYFGFGFGNIVDILSVVIIYFIQILDIFWIILIVLLFKHVINNLVGKLKEVNFVPNYLGIFTSFLFNLSLIYFLHSFWIQLI